MSYRLLAPIISGMCMSLLCPVSGGEKLPQTPPKYIFPIVWTILYILLGISWENTKHGSYADYIYHVLVLLLILWIVVYSCKSNKIRGFYILACLKAVCICCIVLHHDDFSKILLTPLLAWLFIAYSLNYHIID